MSEDQAELRPEQDAGEEESAGAEFLEGRRLRVIRDVDERYVFRFEFGPAILAQVRDKLDLLPAMPLATVTLESAKYPGFYQLFRNERSVYVGRTVRPIGERLAEHRGRLRGRVPLHEITVKFLFVEDLSLLALSEEAMISYFHPLQLDEWGRLGFGSKAPGFGRAAQTSGWDAAFPPNLDMMVEAGVKGKNRKLLHLIASIARGSPIRLSIPKSYRERFAAAHPNDIDVPFSKRPFSVWMDFVERNLASGWRVRREAMTWYVVDD